jgi:hypothetical protein
MSDMLGQNKPATYTDSDGTEQTTTAFIPGFTKTDKEYSNVDLLTFSADAQKIPLTDETVNTVWDRLGALWFTLSARKYSKAGDEAFVSLLREYKRILKQNGALVIDAGGSGNTYELAQDINFKDFGWDVTTAGEGENKIAVLKPIPTQLS